MKHSFGPASLKAMQQVHPSLVRLMTLVLVEIDISVVDGIRTLDQQRLFVAKGLSKTMNSKHLPQPDGLSHALDVVPWAGFDWNAPRATNDLLLFGGFVLGVASQASIGVRYGGDWNGNWKNSDNGFQDLDHFELLDGN